MPVAGVLAGAKARRKGINPLPDRTGVGSPVARGWRSRRCELSCDKSLCLHGQRLFKKRSDISFEVFVAAR